MDGINKFNVLLDPNEVRAIQKKQRNHEAGVVEAASTLIDNVKLATPGTKIKEVSKPKIEEKEKLTEKVRAKIAELILEIEMREGEKEKKGEIPLKIISISATNKEVMFTFDYFNEIATQKYDFVNQKWGDLLKIPKLEFDQFNQSAQ